MTDSDFLSFNESISMTTQPISDRISASSYAEDIVRYKGLSFDKIGYQPQMFINGNDKFSSNVKHLRPFERTFPDRIIIKDIKTSPLLAFILDETTTSLENHLFKNGYPYSIRLLTKIDPEEPKYINRIFHIRVPGITQNKRLELWEKLILSFNTAVKSAKSNIKNNTNKKIIEHLADSIFIEIDMG